MKILVTGSSGYLGEGLVRELSAQGHGVMGLDVREGDLTSRIGSIVDRAFVRHCVAGNDSVVHAATLHKPHLATHRRQDFVDTNITGTLNLLEESVAAGVESFIFTSTTSTFGAALVPPPGEPAAWIDESVPTVPKNIYGVTKAAAEDLCELFHRKQGLPCIILRTSRFFPEEDDDEATRNAYADENSKVNEFLFRRVDLEDAVSAHVAALGRAASIGCATFIISATTPFEREDLAALRVDPERVVARRIPEFRRVYAAKEYRMFPSIDRVYVNLRARRDLGWTPRFDFARVLLQLTRGEPIGSRLAHDIGIKRYHEQEFDHGPYPVE